MVKKIYLLLIVALMGACSDGSQTVSDETNLLQRRRDDTVEYGPELIEDDYDVSRTAKLTYSDGTIIGRTIDSRFLSSLKAIKGSQKQSVYVASRGGSVLYGLKSAHIIRDRKFKIYILDICESACAELILPAAYTLEFIDKPLIGFHLNPIAFANLGSTKLKQNQLYCGIIDARRMEDFLYTSGVNPNFWRDQYKHLGGGKIILEKRKDCYHVFVTHPYEMWYPTSEQLRDDFGLKFTGEVCADDPSCYHTKINNSSSKGMTVAVGNTVYTSQGYDQ